MPARASPTRVQGRGPAGSEPASLGPPGLRALQGGRGHLRSASSLEGGGPTAFSPSPKWTRWPTWPLRAQPDSPTLEAPWFLSLDHRLSCLCGSSEVGSELWDLCSTHCPMTWPWVGACEGLRPTLPGQSVGHPSQRREELWFAGLWAPVVATKAAPAEGAGRATPTSAGGEGSSGRSR